MCQPNAPTEVAGSAAKALKRSAMVAHAWPEGIRHKVTQTLAMFHLLVARSSRPAKAMLVFIAPKRKHAPMGRA